MKNEALDRLFADMAAGIVPDFFSVLSALNELPKLLTLDDRPAEPAQQLTICELNGRCNCSD